MRKFLKYNWLSSCVFAILFSSCSSEEKLLKEPVDVTNFSAIPGELDVTLFWDKNEDSNLAEYWIAINPLLFNNIKIDKELTTYKIEKLESGKTYDFTIFSKDIDNQISKGSTLTTKTITVDRTPPAEVTNFTVLAEDSQVTLNWTKPSDTDLSGYILTFQPGDGSIELDKEITTQIITNLTNGLEYSFTLKARDNSNNISTGRTVTASPAEIIIAPPHEVTEVKFTGFYHATNPTFTVTWTDPSDSDLQEIELTYYDDGGTPSTVTVNKGIQTFTVNGTGKYEKYFTVILKAKNTSGIYSEEVLKYIRLGNLTLSTQTAIDAFNVETVAILAGKLTLTGASINDISRLSSVQAIEGKLDITNTTLTNLNALSNVNFVNGKITITGNTSLDNFCGLKNAMKTFTLDYSVSGNKSNPSKANILSCN